MKNTRILLTILAIISVIGLTPSHATIAPSNVVNVDFGVTSSPALGANPSPVYTGLAAGPGTAGTFWNGLAYEGKTAGIGSFGPTSGLFASDGTTASGISVSLFNVNFYYADEGGGGQLFAAPNGNLLNDFAYVIPNQIGTLTIGGAKAGATYDLYLYSQNAKYNSEDTTFLVNYGGPGATALNGGTTAGGAFIANGNYVVFSGLTGTSTYTVTFTDPADASVNGFQLVETTIPEPSTILLLLTGGMAIYYRRRKFTA